MKKFIAIAVIAILVGGFVLPACKKYDDGPAFTVLTKKMRLDGEWVVESYYEDDVDRTSAYRSLIESELLVMDKKGTWTLTATENFFHTTGTENGTWTWATDKEDLSKVTTSNSPSTLEVWHILRLTNKEFWYHVRDGNGTRLEYHLEPK
ncbi:MAG TPA: hypothetical protein VK826_00550 [Bacteroidia bacterium]|nr:hypothetical protein [Bacteroidia bacterium]